MKPKKRQKLCHNCEGEVDLDVIVCPYCAADLREEKPEQAISLSHTPSFRFPQNPAESLYPSSSVTKEGGTPLHEASFSSPEEKEKSLIAPTIFFTLGVQLLLLGLLIVLFSNKGTVVLKWDARYWVFYVMASIPLLIFGYKKLS